jgi:hypothetical protein
MMVNVITIMQNKNLKEKINQGVEDIIPEPVNESLSDWDIFTLALMKVESEYNNNAVSSVGAKGYFQMTPIYVKEVNRVHHTDYTFSQVTDFDKAYEIFDLMQKAHNPDYDMKKALELHNGKHEWYNRRVFKAMDQIKLYEDMRSKIKNIQS